MEFPVAKSLVCKPILWPKSGGGRDRLGMVCSACQYACVFAKTLGREFKLKSPRFHMFVQVTSTLETLSEAGIDAPAIRRSGIEHKVPRRRTISIVACLYGSSFGADVFIQIECWLSKSSFGSHYML